MNCSVFEVYLYLVTSVYNKHSFVLVTLLHYLRYFSQFKLDTLRWWFHPRGTDSCVIYCSLF